MYLDVTTNLGKLAKNIFFVLNTRLKKLNHQIN